MNGKFLYKIFAWITAVMALSSCSESDFWEPDQAVPEGYIPISFKADIPEMQTVNTRAVDADGIGVQNMTLFCFDSYGLFITTVHADLSIASQTTGTFKSAVPTHTRAIHFVGNEVMTDFSEDDYRNKSEAEVMATLEGSSGRMIYWARFACDANNTASIADQLKATPYNNTITLIRNHAKISLVNPDNQWISITGMAVVNTNAFGTVAPYHPEKGFDFTWPSEDEPFVTLPIDKSKVSDVERVTSKFEHYVFECENNFNDPVSVILRATVDGADKYFRVLLMDEQGEMLPIRRNHNYRINIKGELNYGADTFEAALAGAATNNIWIAISDQVNEVGDGTYTLAVERTSIIVGEDQIAADGTLKLNYTLIKTTGGLTENDKPDVGWLDNNVAQQALQNEFDASTGQGVVTVHLNKMGDNNILSGTIQVKKGVLQRTIKVYTVKTMNFEPAWMSAQIYATIGDVSKKPKATLVFTIPDECPEELFPMRVLISANNLDVRNASGMTLSVINQNEEGYGEPNDWGYKYVYLAQHTGVHKIYLESILSEPDEAEGKIIVEAEHFTTKTLKFHYSTENATIEADDMQSFTNGSVGAEDEPIYYMMVPQKKGAPVAVGLKFNDFNSSYDEDADHQISTQDEFLVYNAYLDYYPDGGNYEDIFGLTTFDCKFYTNDELAKWSSTSKVSEWLQGGHVDAFSHRNGGVSKCHIYMQTNRAKSAEVVRIASNAHGIPSVANPSVDYAATTYRSMIFEIANYYPFRFAASVNDVSGAEKSGAEPEEITDLQFTYVPGQQINIEFDVTSFNGIGQTDSPYQGKYESVDPFGQQFEIYIDAPMLRIDESRLAECNLNGTKLRAVAGQEGRFVYTVEASRTSERNYGVEEAKRKDTTTGSSQNGERKRLPFIVSPVVSAGNIVISANPQQVSYFSKTFSVKNTPIAGALKYRKADGTVTNVPQDAFVRFERTRNGSRIGAVTVTEDGRYELRLRKEYSFTWNTDQVEFIFEDTDGSLYEKTFASLSNLFASQAEIVLDLK